MECQIKSTIFKYTSRFDKICKSYHDEHSNHNNHNDNKGKNNNTEQQRINKLINNQFNWITFSLR